VKEEDPSKPKKKDQDAEDEAEQNNKSETDNQRPDKVYMKNCSIYS